MAAEGRLIAAFVRDPFASDATAVKGAAPFISSPARVFQQLGAQKKSKSCAGKRSNLAARNDGEGERKIEDLERI